MWKSLSQTADVFKESNLGDCGRPACGQRKESQARLTQVGDIRAEAEDKTVARGK